MTPTQCKAAGDFLDWTRKLLSEASEVDVDTIRDFESGRLNLDRATKAAIEGAFESAGVEFVELVGSFGVRLRRLN